MKKHFTLFLGILISCTITAQQNYEKKKFIASDQSVLNYRELKPTEIEKNRSYPLVLFMHGAGERGSDNEKQLFHGSGMFENPVNQEKYPAFVIFPQCPEDKYWAFDSRPTSFMPDSMPLRKDPTPLIKSVKELVDQYALLPEIDKNRIYVIGLSMGGMATYELTGRYPDLFAAAIPICGTVNPQRLQDVKEIAFRIYHGDADSVVPVSGSREAYKTLKKQGADVTYFEFPGVNHGSWHPAFNQPDFMDWLFSQSKNSERENSNLD